MRILSIDAWGNAEDGYEWNQWYEVGQISPEILDLLVSDRDKIEWMVNEGFFSPIAMMDGKMRVEDDQLNYVFVQESDQRPLYAIEYGADE